MIAEAMKNNYRGNIKVTAKQIQYFIMDYPTYSGTTYLTNTVELSKQD